MAVQPSEVLVTNSDADVANADRVTAVIDQILIACWDGFNPVRVLTEDRTNKDSDNIGLLKLPAVRRIIFDRYTTAGWQVEIKQRVNVQNAANWPGERHDVIMSFNKA